MKYFKLFLMILALIGAFVLGILWKTFWYGDTCMDLGGGMNPGGYPICVIKK